MKPPKDLQSRFELKMASRKVKTAEDEAEKLKKEEEERQLVNLFQMLNVPSTIIYNSKPVLKGHSVLKGQPSDHWTLTTQNSVCSSTFL